MPVIIKMIPLPHTIVGSIHHLLRSGCLSCPCLWKKQARHRFQTDLQGSNNRGTHGVFLAEPVSNVIGGSLCFVTMLLTILPELKRLEKKNGEADRLSGDFKTR